MYKNYWDYLKTILFKLNLLTFFKHITTFFNSEWNSTILPLDFTDMWHKKIFKSSEHQKSSVHHFWLNGNITFWMCIYQNKKLMNFFWSIIWAEWVNFLKTETIKIPCNNLFQLETDTIMFSIVSCKIQFNLP